jgi:tetratricopeptide (TPR) repeat protein
VLLFDLDDDVITDAELVDGDERPEAMPTLDAGYGILPVDAPVSFELPGARPTGVFAKDLPGEADSNDPLVSVFDDDASDLDDAFADADFEEFVLDEPDAAPPARLEQPNIIDDTAAVSAPVGRPSPGMTLVFGPTAGALGAHHDEDFKAAMELARTGQVHEALEALQEQLFGDFPVAASFELSALRIQMGEYLDASRALEALQNAPDLTDLDGMLIQYYRALCLEALSDFQPASDIWRSLQSLAPGQFPDVSVRLRRAG